MGHSVAPAALVLLTLALSGAAANASPTLPARPASATAPSSGAVVAAGAAQELRCQEFSYVPGPTTVSSTQGLLTCRIRRHHLDVHVFESADARARGIAHVKLWSGPDTYWFARDHRVVVVPRGGGMTPAFSRKWAGIAAERMGGAVFQG